MADPATLITVAKTTLTVGSNKKVWTVIGTIIAALCLPFILAIMCFIVLSSGGTNHNQAAVRLAFNGGTFPAGMPEDYRGYVTAMQDSFGELDLALGEINDMTEGSKPDPLLVKSVFYALYFGADRLRLDQTEYQSFADCFVRYEERTRIIKNPDKSETKEVYTVAVAITDMTEIYQNLSIVQGKTATDEQQANAVNILHLIKYGTAPPLEGDSFGDWSDWNSGEAVAVYDLPASAVGEKIVALAQSRLGHPYSQSRRGTGNYVDCSYLTMWCYRQLGIELPGTAAEQGRYCVENKLTVAKEDLQPGDLVFWSHKPNGRFMNITHTGVYAGDGMVVDASSSKGKVVWRNLFDSDKQVLYGRPE